MLPWVALLLPVALQGSRLDVDLTQDDAEGCKTYTGKKCSFRADCKTPNSECVKQDRLTRDQCHCKPGYCVVQGNVCEATAEQVQKEEAERWKAEQAQRDADSRKMSELQTLFQQGNQAFEAGKQCYRQVVGRADSSGAAACKTWFDTALRRLSELKRSEKPRNWEQAYTETIDEYLQKIQQSRSNLEKHMPREERHQTTEGRARLKQKRSEQQQEIGRLKQKRLFKIKQQPRCTGKPVTHCGLADKGESFGAFERYKFCQRHYATEAFSFEGFEPLMASGEDWHFPAQCYWLVDSSTCTQGNKNLRQLCDPDK